MIHSTDPIGPWTLILDHRGNPVNGLFAVDPETGEAIQALPQFFRGWFKPILRYFSTFTGEVPTRHFFLRRGFTVMYLRNPFGK